ncbi:nucleotide exchange factor GrpE [Microlunatus soli]|uniref:Protein GrpE n=1 Tax=Microlunatus soli TaxID=630515 RepID=A0A1H1VK81_9ACTN|nr:nucleotide exchange factor GrpE [Microlunatus soli]SDS84761.1 molecular chaperone GrpE [Microlunatus soli]
MTQGDPEDTSGRPTVRDKRRIDPQTYELREPEATTAEPDAQPQQAEGADTGTPADAAAGPGEAAASAELEQVKGQLADRTADLQRVQAEYVNYKRRVDRDRDLSRRAGVEQVLTELMPVLDGLQTAREHEELSGGFKAFADEVTKIATKYGLESFGEAGDPFDPRIHEALMHAQGEGLTGPTCVTILQPGYRIGDRILRPARVAVAEPDEAAAGDQQAAADGVSDQPAPDQGAADQTGDQGAAGSQQ